MHYPLWDILEGSRLLWYHPGMDKPRKRIPKKWWVILALWLSIAYPMSAGPLLGFRSRGMFPWPLGAVYDFVYAPVILCYLHAPQWLHDVMDWYTRLWLP